MSICMCACVHAGVCASRLVVFDSLRPYGLLPTRLISPCASPGKNTGVRCHSLLQGLFLTQGLNPGLLHCRQILYRLNSQGSLCLCVYICVCLCVCVCVCVCITTSLSIYLLLDI